MTTHDAIFADHSNFPTEDRHHSPNSRTGRKQTSRRVEGEHSPAHEAPDAGPTARVSILLNVSEPEAENERMLSACKDKHCL